MSDGKDRKGDAHKTFSGDHTGAVKRSVGGLRFFCLLVNVLSAIHEQTDHSADHDGRVKVDWQIKTDSERHYRNS